MENDDNSVKYLSFNGKILTFLHKDKIKQLSLGARVKALQDFPDFIKMNQILKITKFYMTNKIITEAGQELLAHFEGFQVAYPVSAFEEYYFNPIKFWKSL